jgi:TonB family protein
MKKILIIDYDQNSLASLHGIFAGQGYQVVTAADGQTGWDKYNKESPDLVLMEAMLPKVHGFELCQRITSERNSQATVFIMTGVYKDRVYRTEALRTYGASEYFEKPLKMTELLASVEAVLGRPEPRPAEARLAAGPPAPAASLRAVPPEPAPAEPRKRERPKSDDSIFSLPDDLDRMSREMPKPRKPVPPRREPAAESRLDAMADELLKTVITEATAPKTVHAKPGNGNGNGNGNAEIDRFLKSALAGLGLSKDKVKVPKTAPLPPPPPVEEKPHPTASRAAIPDPMPAPPRHPAASFTPPAMTDMKNTLTPGDPGSDISPFFTPEKPKPAEKAERKVATPPEPVRREAPGRESVPHEPARHEPAKHEPAPHESKNREADAIASADIFSDIAEPKEKKGFPKILVIGLGVVALAAVGFILLRPKRPAAIEATPQQSSQDLSRANEPAPPAENVAAPVVKPAPAKRKAQPQTKPADPGPAGADAILPTGPPAAALPMPGTPLGSGSGNDRTPSGTSPPGADPAAAKAAEAAPPVTKTDANPTPTVAAESGAAAGPGTSAAAPAPITPPVNEGDLVELGAVTELPRLVKTVDPVYPQTAQRVGREGQITVNALIDEKGNVIDTVILKGIQDDKGLGRAAEIAVRKWKFQPARKNGVAVKVWKSFVIAFKADTNPADTIE